MTPQRTIYVYQTDKFQYTIYVWKDGQVHENFSVNIAGDLFVGNIESFARSMKFDHALKELVKS